MAEHNYSPSSSLASSSASSLIPEQKWRLSTPRKRISTKSSTSNNATSAHDNGGGTTSGIPTYLSPTSSEEGDVVVYTGRVGDGGGGVHVADDYHYDHPSIPIPIHHHRRQSTPYQHYHHRHSSHSHSHDDDDDEEEKENVASPTLSRSMTTNTKTTTTTAMRQSTPYYPRKLPPTTTTKTTSSSAAAVAATTTSPLLWKEEGAALRLKQRLQVQQRASSISDAASKDARFSISSLATIGTAATTTTTRASSQHHHQHHGQRHGHLEKRVSFSPEQPSRYSFCSIFQSSLATLPSPTTNANSPPRYHHHQQQTQQRMIPAQHRWSNLSNATTMTTSTFVIQEDNGVEDVHDDDDDHEHDTNKDGWVGPRTGPSNSLGNHLKPEPPQTLPPPPLPPTLSSSPLLHQQPSMEELIEHNEDDVADEEHWVGDHHHHQDVNTTPTSTMNGERKSMLHESPPVTTTSPDSPTVPQEQVPLAPQGQVPLQDDDHHHHFLLHDVCQHAKQGSDLVACISQLQQLQQQQNVEQNVTLADLVEALDPQGQTVLHVLSENDRLAQSLFHRTTTAKTTSIGGSSFRRHSTPQEEQKEREENKEIVLEFVVAFLLQVSCCSAMTLLTTRDNHGYLPFEKILRQWVLQQHDDALREQQQRQQKPSRTSSLSRLFSTTSWVKPTTLWTTTTTTTTTIDGANNKNNKRMASNATIMTATSNLHRMTSGGSNHGDNAADDKHAKRQTNPHKSPSLRRVQAPSSWSVNSRSNNGDHDPSATTVVDLDEEEEDDDLEDPPSLDQDQHNHSRQRSPKDITCDNPLLFAVYPHVQMTAPAYFAFTLLSAILDALQQRCNDDDDDDDDRIASTLRHPRQHNNYNNTSVADARHIHATLVRTMALIPGLLQTLLLLSSKGDRPWVLQCSLVQAVLRQTESVGPWLTAMLRQAGDNTRVSEAALDYLQLISQDFPKESSHYHNDATTLPQDPRHRRRSNGSNNNNNNNKHRWSWSSASTTSSTADDDGDNKGSTRQKTRQQELQDLYDEISRLDDFIPSLLALGERGIEEAATTRVVRRVLDQMISRPFSVSVVVGDAMFLGLLVGSFRQAVNSFLLGYEPSTALRWVYVANAGIFYFIIRELGKAVSLWMITRTAKTYFGSFWNLSDMLCTILALCSTVALRFHYNYYADADLDDTQQLRQLLAVTTGFLWLRVLNLLKAINMQLATFVLAILQITRDILWFCAIVLTLVVSFAQAFYTLLLPGSCAASPGRTNDYHPQKECTQTEYYLSVYSVLLGGFGNFQRSEFGTPFSVFMIVCFSFMVEIILLNVLIAVASDSYEKCLMRAQNLFGRARVMLIAELVSFQNLLRKHVVKDHSHSLATTTTATSVFRKRIWWGIFWKNRGWSPGSVVFFKVSTVVVVGWTLGEIIGYMTGERRHGNILLSLGSILVNVLLFIFMIAFLQNRVDGLPDDVNQIYNHHHHHPNTGSQRGQSQPQQQKPRPPWPWGTSQAMVGVLTSWYDRVAQKAVLRMFGSMQETSSRRRRVSGGNNNNTGEEWNGRLLYWQGQMRQMIEESHQATLEHLRATEMRMMESHEHFRQDLLEVLLQQQQQHQQQQQQQRPSWGVHEH